MGTLRHRLLLLGGLAAALSLPAAACGSSSTAVRSSAGAAAQPRAQPATPAGDVTDTYHGVTVADPYRWLEDWDEPRVKAWSDAQNAWARRHLDAIDGRDRIHDELGRLLRAKVIRYGAVQDRAGRLFAIKREPPRQQPFLVVRAGLAAGARERVLLDPGALDAAGTTAIDWYVASPDGATVAVSLSVGGSESGAVHFYDVASGREVFESIPRVNGGTAGGALAWTPDGKGVWYTRYPHAGERPEEDLGFYVQLWFHTLGQPVERDRYELGRGFPRIAEYRLDVQPGGGRLLVTVQDGDGGEFAHHLREPDGSWRQLSDFGDKTLVAVFGPDEDLYLLSRAGAPRGKIVRVGLKDLDVAAGRLVVPQGQDTIVEDFWGPPTVVPTASRLYVLYQLGGPSAIRVFTLDGSPLAAPRQPDVAAVGSMTLLHDGSLLFAAETFTRPRQWIRFDSALDEAAGTALSSESPADFSDVLVVRERARSRDGTAVPVNVLYPAGTEPGGRAPCVVYGYGGYGVNIVPRFRVGNRLLYDRGVVYAVANLRGGGEFGEAWHRGGSLTHKQNVFDDFHAALRHLIDQGHCAHDRVGIMGGSNGGLLMGATMTQHPEVPAAVASLVGIYDMLRVERSPNGAFNVTEFGTVADEAQFRALYAYSPYHRVVDGTVYPPTLFTTGANDPRVDPMQSRKMTARLQAATGGDAPILLRTSMKTGHGGDTALDERVALLTDVFGFLLHHLGALERTPAAR